MLHVLKSEVFIRGRGEREGGELGSLFLKFLDPPLHSMQNNFDITLLTAN